MKRLTSVVCLVLALSATTALAETPDFLRVFEPGKKPQDRRLGPPKTLDDYFPFTPPATKEAWEKRRQELRQQILVANGLWPLPPKTPLTPVIHGKIERDTYTVEKVFFASYPGHYVCGNLYRPKAGGKHPGVLVAHGHWKDARLADALEATAVKEIKRGAEKTSEGARYLHQAISAQLARMGCVVFMYDMVGNSDSKKIPHTVGFTDADAELHLQSFMGLQTWNSVRALDFLLGLPEVDSTRIGMTGASGGGTQTFILSAIDDRLTAAFPAVMVSTAMQGGCICENCSLLRQNTGNVEIAGLFAPRPLGMTGANDWTKEIETKGLPQLKALYKLYGAEDRVMAKAFLQFDHNYNQVSREVMYNWFNKHLKLGQKSPVTEQPFVPVPPKELSVFDEQHTRPADELSADALRKKMTETSDRQMEALKPKDAKGLAEFRRVVGTALRIMVNDTLPDRKDVEETRRGDLKKKDGYIYQNLLIGRKGQGEQIPAVGLFPENVGRTIVVWIHPEGRASLFKDGKLVPAAKQLLTQGAGILAVDVLQTGELKYGKPVVLDSKRKNYAGYTYGYNRPLLANRVHDILTAVAFARGRGTKTVHLIGFEEAGPWVLLARGLCGDAVSRTVADVNQFRFEKVRKIDDEMMLPGALKYGGLSALSALAAPGELFVHNQRGSGMGQWLQAVYKAAGSADHLERQAEKLSMEKGVAWLLR
jgi:dienelactone hydrolase